MSLTPRRFENDASVPQRRRHELRGILWTTARHVFDEGRGLAVRCWTRIVSRSTEHLKRVSLENIKETLIDARAKRRGNLAGCKKINRRGVTLSTGKQKWGVCWFLESSTRIEIRVNTSPRVLKYYWTWCLITDRSMSHDIVKSNSSLTKQPSAQVEL